MPFERPPEGLSVAAEPDAVTLAIHPYLPESGRSDLRLLRAARYVLVAASLFGVILGDALARVGALVLLVGGVAWMVAVAVRGARRQRAELTARIGRDELRVTVRTDGRVDREDQALLREVGRVDVVEAGYQRWHVVANVVGRKDALVIEMERHTAEAAHWVAKELAAAGKRARERGGSVADVPPTLSKLTE
jgi:hypothetical protein